MYIRVFSCLFVLCLLAGCTPLSRVSPVATIRTINFKHVTVLPPRVDVYEIGAGGIREKMDEWSQKAAENIEAALVGNLGAMSKLQVTRFPKTGAPAAIMSALTDTDLLYDAINRSLLLHSYGLLNNHFKDHRFELSLGHEIAELKKIVDAEAFLFVRGSDEISSPGRIALQGATVIAAAALGVLIIPQSGISSLSLALVDANDGTILWHSFHRASAATDLRNPGSAGVMVREALAGFPIK